MSFQSALIYFGAITLFMVMIEIMFTYATKGFAFGFSSNRDPQTEFSGLAMRIKNAYRNQVESAAYIVPILVVAAMSDLQSESAQIAALFIVIGRAMFAVLYYVGIPFARVVGFSMASFATLFIAYSLLIA